MGFSTGRGGFAAAGCGFPPGPSGSSPAGGGLSTAARPYGCCGPSASTAVRRRGLVDGRAKAWSLLTGLRKRALRRPRPLSTGLRRRGLVEGGEERWGLAENEAGPSELAGSRLEDARRAPEPVPFPGPRPHPSLPSPFGGGEGAGEGVRVGWGSVETAPSAAAVRRAVAGPSAGQCAAPQSGSTPALGRAAHRPQPGTAPASAGRCSTQLGSAPFGSSTSAPSSTSFSMKFS